MGFLLWQETQTSSTSLAPICPERGWQPLAVGARPRYVVLLRFSRSPAAFRDRLLHAPEFHEFRYVLGRHGRKVELASGAKIFVSPVIYNDVLAALQFYNIQLSRKNVIVE